MMLMGGIEAAEGKLYLLPGTAFGVSGEAAATGGAFGGAASAAGVGSSGRHCGE